MIRMTYLEGHDADRIDSVVTDTNIQPVIQAEDLGVVVFIVRVRSCGPGSTTLVQIKIKYRPVGGCNTIAGAAAEYCDARAKRYGGARTQLL